MGAKSARHSSRNSLTSTLGARYFHGAGPGWGCASCRIDHMLFTSALARVPDRRRVCCSTTTACVSRHPAPRQPMRPGPSRRATLPTSRGRSTGRTSASGERFDERRLVAAHRTLPFGSIVRVTNVKNGRSVTVRIMDRGPYGQNYREGTVIDLSRAAASRLRMLRDEQIPARLEILELGDDRDGYARHPPHSAKPSPASRSISASTCSAVGLPCGRRAGPTGTPRRPISALAAPM